MDQITKSSYVTPQLLVGSIHTNIFMTLYNLLDEFYRIILIYILYRNNVKFQLNG